MRSVLGPSASSTSPGTRCVGVCEVWRRRVWASVCRAYNKCSPRYKKEE